MTKINISQAPQIYQPYLKVGDAGDGEKNNNGKIDDQAEAETAAEAYCAEKSAAKCQKFLSYLEGAGYHLKLDITGIQNLPANLEIFLTFDDGPAPEENPRTEHILNVLGQNNIEATFFVEHSNILDKYRQALLKKTVGDGHVVGVHGVDPIKHHRPHQDTPEFEEKLKSMRDLIKGITGSYPIFIRPPYGWGGWEKGRIWNKPKLRKMYKEFDMVRIDGWEAEVGKSGFWKNVEEKMKKAAKGDTQKLIILAHDLREYDAVNLPEIIRVIRAKAAKYKLKVKYLTLREFYYLKIGDAGDGEKADREKMTIIIISQAPQIYQPYLKVGDEGDGGERNNGKIDDQAEAETAAEAYCDEKPAAKCQKFLSYLERLGYAMPSNNSDYPEEKYLEKIAGKTGLEEAPFSALWVFEREREGLIKRYGIELKRIVRETGLEEAVFKTLWVFEREREGLIKRYGIEKVRYLLLEIDKEAKVGSGTWMAFDALQGLAETGRFEKVGPSNLIKIARAARGRTWLAYTALIKLAEKEGLIEKIGLSNLIKTAQAAKGITWSAYYALGTLSEKGLVNRYGIAKIIAILLELSKIDDNTGWVFTALERLAENGQVERHGIDEINAFLLEITGAVGGRRGDAFRTLAKLAHKKLIDKFGLANLTEIAKAAKGRTFLAYLEIERLGDKGLIARVGVPELVRLAKVNGPNTYLAYKKLMKHRE